MPPIHQVSSCARPSGALDRMEMEDQRAEDGHTRLRLVLGMPTLGRPTSTPAVDNAILKAVRFAN